MWILAQGKASDDRATLSALTTSGGRFAASDPVQVHNWGTITVRFDDCNHGTVQWAPLDPALAPGSMPITRLTQLYGSACSGGISDDAGGAALGTSGVGAEGFLANTGVVPQARAHARFEQFGDHASFEVELEDLPAGSYSLFVDGQERATIDVAAAPGGTQGEVEFRSPVEPGKLLLDFDPRGKAIEVRQGATVFFSATLGAGGATPPPSTGTPPPTGSAAYVLRVEPQGNDGPELYAELVQRADRVEFKVELEDVATGTYAIRVGGAVVGELEVLPLPGGTQGEIEFRNPAEAGKAPLDFDPRGALVEAVRNGVVALAGTFPAQPTGTPPDSEDNGSDDPPGDDNGGGDDDGGGTAAISLDADLQSTGVDGNANGFASYSQTANEREFEVQIEDVPDGSYTLTVGGVARGTIEVSDERGEIRFNAPLRSGRPLLDFDPRGQRIEVGKGGLTYLAADFPS
jgi:hypothetical protein